MEICTKIYYQSLTCIFHIGQYVGRLTKMNLTHVSYRRFPVFRSVTISTLSTAGILWERVNLFLFTHKPQVFYMFSDKFSCKLKSTHLSFYTWKFHTGNTLLHLFLFSSLPDILFLSKVHLLTNSVSANCYEVSKGNFFPTTLKNAHEASGYSHNPG